jgi:hypothetical protein
VSKPSSSSPKKKDTLTKRTKSQGTLLSRKFKPKTPKTPAPPVPGGIPPATVPPPATWNAGAAPPGPRPITTLPRPIGRPAQPVQPIPPARVFLPTGPPRTAKELATKKGNRAGLAFYNVPPPGDVVLADLADHREAMVRIQDAGVELPIMRLAVEALRGVRIETMPLDQLTATVVAVAALFDKIKDMPDDAVAGLEAVNHLEVALAMRRRKLVQDELAQYIRIDRADAVPLPQLRILIDFMSRNPDFAAYARGEKIGLVFDSGVASDQGGGIFAGGDVHLHGQQDLLPDRYLRLVLHEFGHGTYQRKVMPELPSKAFDRGGYANLRKEMARLREAAAAEGAADVTRSSVAARYASLEAEMAKKKYAKEWADMSADARTLHDAWDVIRQQNDYFQGVDLGGDKTPASRQAYQKGWLTEFCAETFMLVATGEIAEHLDYIRTTDGIPAEVKAAWEDSVRILDQYARRDVLARTDPI